MEILDNDLGGKSIILFAGDDLERIPASHRPLLTPVVRSAFSDPSGYLESLILRCRFGQMAAWLRGLLLKNEWRLELHHSDDHASAGFGWRGGKVIGAMIGFPAEHEVSGLPAVLQEVGRIMELSQVYLLGTIADTINWIFGELLVRRYPDWNYRLWDETPRKNPQ